MKTLAQVQNRTGKGVTSPLTLGRGSIAIVWAIFSIALGCPSAGAADLPEKPNILFILADDLGYTDLGCYGSGYYETPNLDRLAGEGMRFTSNYSNGPNCQPTRACLMSGRYTPRHGVYTVATGARGKEKFRKMIPVENHTRLPLSEVTLARVLKDAGYATAHAGKWHLGNGDYLPDRRGFDFNFGGSAAGSPRSYFSPYHNPHLADGPKGEQLTDRLTREIIRFIEAHRDRPFFAYLATYAVHTPLQAKPEKIAKYKAKPPVNGHHNPTYAAMIESVDENVGRLLATLDRLGLTEKTIVIFTSDNGGVGGYVDAGVRGAREITNNAPLRGGKGMLYEGGIRVPLMVKWPGIVKPGATCDEPVISLDFYPTLAELAGATVPSRQQLDGESILPLLTSGGRAKLARDAIYWHFPGYLQANARLGTWRTTPVGAIRKGDFKLIEFFEDSHTELYNLQNDIGERHDLSAAMPGKTRELYDQLEAWRQRVKAPMPKIKP